MYGRRLHASARFCGEFVSGTTFKVVDLFAGAGGFSLAASQVGCQIVFAVEHDRNAALTYQSNIAIDKRSRHVVLYDRDVRLLSAADLAAEHFPNGGGCDLLLGGPPCQGFSVHRFKDAGVDDPRNALIHEYFEFVRHLQPRAFLLENVPGMLWVRHRTYLDELYRQAHASGYMVYEPKKLDARNYGVPQRRERIFILGLRPDVKVDDFVWPPSATHASPSNIDAVGMEPWLNCERAFRPADHDDPNDVHMNHGPALRNAFAQTPVNGGSRRDSGRTLKCHTRHDGHSDVYGRIDPSAPAPTMTTACINPSKGRFVHPTLHHGITARQAARIQTFPDDYIFMGGLMAAGQQIGNAVPVVLAERLIGHIKALLMSETNIAGHNTRNYGMRHAG